MVQQWVVDAYLLTLGALILVAGSLSDQFGRVRVLQWGLAGFTATSVLCGLAWSGESLIVARGLQGVAGALLVPSSLALIVAVFTGPAQSLAIGKWSAWTSGAIVVAPLLGGISVDVWTWRVIFFLNDVPAVAVWPVLLRLRELDHARTPGSQIDVTGTLLAIVGLGGPVYAFIARGSQGWDSPQVWVPLAAGVAAFIAFLVHEARTPSPDDAPAALRHPQLRLGQYRNDGDLRGDVARLLRPGPLSSAGGGPGRHRGRNGHAAVNPDPAAVVVTDRRPRGPLRSPLVHDRRSAAVRGRFPAALGGGLAAGLLRPGPARTAGLRTGGWPSRWLR